jgi:hypothetical protein
VVKPSVVNKPKDVIDERDKRNGGRLSEELAKYNGLLTEATMWYAQNGFKPYIDAIQRTGNPHQLAERDESSLMM